MRYPSCYIDHRFIERRHIFTTAWYNHSTIKTGCSLVVRLALRTGSKLVSHAGRMSSFLLLKENHQVLMSNSLFEVVVRGLCKVQIQTLAIIISSLSCCNPNLQTIASVRCNSSEPLVFFKNLN